MSRAFFLRFWVDGVFAVERIMSLSLLVERPLLLSLVRLTSPFVVSSPPLTLA